MLPVILLRLVRQATKALIAMFAAGPAVGGVMAMAVATAWAIGVV
jgi:hypothetical protein